MEFRVLSRLVWIAWVLPLISSVTSACKDSLPPEETHSEKSSSELYSGLSPGDVSKSRLEAEEYGSQPHFKLRFHSFPGEKQAFRTRVNLVHGRGETTSRAYFDAIAVLKNKGETKGGYLFELTFPRLEKYSPRVGRSEITGILQNRRWAFVINELGETSGGGESTGIHKDPYSSPGLPGAVWPDAPVGMGARWTFVSLGKTDFIDQSEQTSNPPLRSVAETAYHIESIRTVRGRKTAFISKRTSLRFEDENGKMRKKGTGGGEIEFDIKNGRILRSKFDVEMFSEKPGSGITHKQEISMTRVSDRSLGGV